MATMLTAEAQAALSRLAHYRLRENLTYKQLSEVMAAKGWYVPGRSLHLALTGRCVPVDRTMWRIEQFAAELRMFDPPARNAKRPA